MGRTIVQRRVGRAESDARARLSAFTLVELMVVIAIIGIMTAMMLPEMRGTYQDALLRSTSRQLISVFDVASSHAISVNQAHRVRFDHKTGRYVIEKVTPGRGPESGHVPARDVPGGEGQLDTRISIQLRPIVDVPIQGNDQPAVAAPEQSAPPEMPEEAITFYPDGTADAAEVVLRDQDGFRLALRINAITARVRIIELARQ